MKLIQSFLIIITLLITGSIGLPTYAYETAGPLTIEKLWIGDDGSFRVALDSTTAHCTGGPISPAWSYLGATDTGFKTKMATLLSAYLSGKTVVLTTEALTGGDGSTYCHIIEFWVY